LTARVKPASAAGDLLTKHCVPYRTHSVLRIVRTTCSAPWVMRCVFVFQTRLLSKSLMNCTVLFTQIKLLQQVVRYGRCFI